MGRSEKFSEASFGPKDDLVYPATKKSASGKEKSSTPALGRVTSTATDSSRIELVHLEDIQSEDHKLSKKKKFQRHCARFWLCYIIAATIFAAIFLPLLFLEIVPALAQALVNGTPLPIYAASLKALSNDAVLIGLETGLSVPAGLTVKLDPLELWLYNTETPEFSPYTMVPLAGQSIHGKTTITVKDTTVQVDNRTELHTWLRRMLYQKETVISVWGHTKAHLGALHFGINLQKTVSIAALDELRGFSLVDARIVLPARSDGTNLIGNITLPNWSDLTIGLGNLTLNAWAGDLLIGSVAVFNVLLPPGNTTMPFKGEVFIPTLLDNLDQLLASQADALTDGMLEIGVSGNKTIVDGQHITYIEEVLNGAHILSRISIAELLTDGVQSLLGGDIGSGGLGKSIQDDLDKLYKELGGDSGNDTLSNLLDDLGKFGDRRRDALRKGESGNAAFADLLGDLKKFNRRRQETQSVKVR